MLYRFTKVVIVICGLVIFEALLLGLIVFFSADASCRQKIEPVSVLSAPIIKNESKFQLVSGVVPHHDLASQIIEDFFQNVAEQDKPKTIVIISPDHYNASFLQSGVDFIALEKSTVSYRGLSVAENLSPKLVGLNFVYNDSYVNLEHGINNLLPAIKKYLPEAEILPIIVPAKMPRAEIENLVKILAEQPNIFIVSSTDFSHYLPESVADFHDVMSQRVLINFEQDNFPNLEVDCWQCLYASRLAASLKKSEDYEFIAANNSVDFSRSDKDSETTSYFSVIFGAGDFGSQPEFSGQTLFFSGDMMFDRNVEKLMQKNSLRYPFAQVSTLFKGSDWTAANLEGPIVKEPQDFGPQSLSFNFDDEIIPVLKENCLNIFCLANNHILNKGQAGMAETKKLLADNNLSYFGDPFKCGADLALIKGEFIFFGINKTYPTSCSDSQISEAIKKLKQENPSSFLIVNIHWGNEYQTVNSRVQSVTAHSLIDSGADLIIGHHPHVTQNIEKYHGKLIFYSLGNFIFDQYFSQATQEGLVVGLEYYQNKLIYRLFPVESKLSQPKLMINDTKVKFLTNLAKISSASISEQVKSGIINLE